MNGISVDLRGSTIDNTLHVTGTPPGKVLFNDTACCNSSVAAPARCSARKPPISSTRTMPRPRHRLDHPGRAATPQTPADLLEKLITVLQGGVNREPTAIEMKISLRTLAA